MLGSLLVSFPLRAQEPEFYTFLLREAAAVREHAYAPYSGYRVGAAAASSTDAVFRGANMENAVYGLGVCAEVGVLTAATAAGRLADLRALALVGDSPGGTEGESVIVPCGRCRQLIMETAQLAENDIEVIGASPDLKRVRFYTITELLPEAFGAQFLTNR
jgi:cytidine deaminase